MIMSLYGPMRKDILFNNFDCKEFEFCARLLACIDQDIRGQSSIN